MTAADSTTTVAGPMTQAVPLMFSVRQGHCLGWFHAAHAAHTTSRRTGVVLCRPLGYESICAYGVYTHLAETFALSGFDVIRFDYQGTGDSSGDDTQPDRVASWLDSIAAATLELKRLSNVTSVVFVGMRLGATLAVKAALQLGGVDSLIMWAPCPTGRSFVRELRAASGNRKLMDSAQGDMEALGFLFSNQTITDLQSLDCLNISQAPAKNVLILGRDDMPGQGATGPLPVRYGELGMQVTYAVVPGYAEMMLEPRESKLSDATLAQLTDWLSAVHPVCLDPTGKTSDLGDIGDSGDLDRSAKAASFTDRSSDGWRERALRFGPDHLFGVLTTPAVLPTSNRRGDTAVLLLNVGGNYRIGPNRIYVRMARYFAALGYQAMRFDLPGLGDSRLADGFSIGNLYSTDSRLQVKSAIDFMAANGCNRFFLLGICSGSFVAFHAALADARVTGQILLNSRLLEWQEKAEVGNSSTWQGPMQRYYKSTHFYQRALFNPEVYKRLVRGQIDISGIANRFHSVIKAKLSRALKNLVQGSQAKEDENVLGKLKYLCTRGTDTLLIVSAEDDGRDYVEFHFGKMGERMKGNSLFKMVVIEEADHTFSDTKSQRAVMSAIQIHLQKHDLVSSQGSALAPSAASSAGNGASLGGNLANWM